MKRDRSIYQFLDYREFLKARLHDLKSQKAYSARAFAQRAGFGSPSFLKMILDGKRNLTQASLEKVARGLKLTKPETQFFSALVHFTQAVDSQEKAQSYKKLLSFKKFLSIRRVEADQFEYFSHWYTVAVREAMVGKLKSLSHSELAKRLEITEEQVASTVDLIKKLGLDTGEAVQTPREMTSLVVRSYHREMILKGLESIDKVAADERDLGALTVALSRDNYLEFKKKLAQFRREMNVLFSSDPDAEQVYQLNFQLFPLLSVEASSESAKRK